MCKVVMTVCSTTLFLSKWGILMHYADAPFTYTQFQTLVFIFAQKSTFQSETHETQDLRTAIVIPHQIRKNPNFYLGPSTYFIKTQEMAPLEKKCFIIEGRKCEASLVYWELFT